MKIIDTHTHLNDVAFEKDVEKVIEKAKEKGVIKVINSADTLASFENIKKLSSLYPEFCYGTYGVHPNEVKGENDLIELEKVIKDKTINLVGVGEIGLDYHYNPSEENKELQKRIFIGQIKIAEKYNLPIVIHSRDADFDTFYIVTKLKVKVPVDLHCYSGSYELAMRYIANGIDIHFGIGGVVTFKNAKRLVEVVEKVPTERLLLETDAPYLAPTPYRGQRNEPSYLKEVIKKFSQIKNIEENELSEMLINNTKRVFKI